VLQPRERSKPLARVVDEPLAHFQGHPAPSGNEVSGVLPISLPQLVVNQPRQHIAQQSEPAGAGQLGDGVAEVAAGRAVIRHLKKLPFQTPNIDGHNPSPQRAQCTGDRLRYC